MNQLKQLLACLAVIVLCVSMNTQASNIGLTITPCADVLKLNSNNWVQQYTIAKGNNALEHVKAILRYEYCYSQYLDQLHDQIIKTHEY